MPRALNLLRAALHYRRECFNEGLRAAGFDVVETLLRPGREDVLVIWNRYGPYAERAWQFEAAGGTVLVAENGLLGKSWRAGEWFSLARGNVAMAGGEFPAGGPERWDFWGVEMAPYRSGGEEVVIFGQRGIGAPGLRSPDNWAESVRARIGGRIRLHPGTGDGIPLEEDLRRASEVVTWNSGAALKALMLGVPTWFSCPHWIGAGAALHLSNWPGEPLCDEVARLAMFRRAAWAMWTLDEIRTGEPIARTLAA